MIVRQATALLLVLSLLSTPVLSPRLSAVAVADEPNGAVAPPPSVHLLEREAEELLVLIRSYKKQDLERLSSETSTLVSRVFLRTFMFVTNAAPLAAHSPQWVKTIDAVIHEAANLFVEITEPYADVGKSPESWREIREHSAGSSLRYGKQKQNEFLRTLGDALNLVGQRIRHVSVNVVFRDLLRIFPLKKDSSSVSGWKWGAPSAPLVPFTLGEDQRRSAMLKEIGLNLREQIQDAQKSLEDPAREQQVQVALNAFNQFQQGVSGSEPVRDYNRNRSARNWFIILGVFFFLNPPFEYTFERTQYSVDWASFINLAFFWRLARIRVIDSGMAYMRIMREYANLALAQPLTSGRGNCQKVFGGY